MNATVIMQYSSLIPFDIDFDIFNNLKVRYNVIVVNNWEYKRNICQNNEFSVKNQI